MNSNTSSAIVVSVIAVSIGTCTSIKEYSLRQTDIQKEITKQKELEYKILKMEKDSLGNDY